MYGRLGNLTRSEVESFLLQLGFEKIDSRFEIKHDCLLWSAIFSLQELHINVRPLDRNLKGIEWNKIRRIENINGIGCIAEMMLNVYPAHESTGCAGIEIPDCAKIELSRNGMIFFSQSKLSENKYCDPEEQI